MRFILFVLLIPLTMGLPVQRICGCFRTTIDSFNCSHEKIVDFECLSREKPVEVLLIGNNYTTLREGLHNLTSIKYINLSHNNITHLPNGIHEFWPALETLNLEHNKLTYPKELFQIPKGVKTFVNRNLFECVCDSDVNKLRIHIMDLSTTVMCSTTDSGTEKSVSFTTFCFDQIEEYPKWYKDKVLLGCVIAFIVGIVFCPIFVRVLYVRARIQHR